MSEPKTVKDVLASIHTALRWAGKKNPNKALLVECAFAITQLAHELTEARAKLEQTATTLETL